MLTPIIYRRVDVSMWVWADSAQQMEKTLEECSGVEKECSMSLSPTAGIIGQLFCLTVCEY